MKNTPTISGVIGFGGSVFCCKEQYFVVICSYIELQGVISMSSPISVRLEDSLNEALDQYTTAKGISKAEFIRTAITEKLEDDYDITLADKVYEEWLEDDRKTISFSEMMERYG